MAIRTTLQSLLEVIQSREPDVQFHLRPPATKQRIRDAETALGYDLPEQLVELLSVHDGQDEPTDRHRYQPLLMSVPLGLGSLTSDIYSILPVQQIVAKTKLWQKHMQMAHDRFGFDRCREGNQIVGPTSYHMQRLIIGHVDDFISLDAEPATGGEHWQVVTLDHDPPVISVVADSLDSHMKNIIRLIEEGKTPISASYNLE